jgi:prepilin-type N-terminal cleavage/methylation domain-containing protein
MSRRKLQAGFSLVELMIVIVMVGVVSTTTYTFFLTSFNQYLALQTEGMVDADLAMQSQRIASVMRGITDITAATNADITLYAYFSPSDAYVSEIKYYKNGAGNKLLADVTPLTANPPAGTLITASKQTYTIVDPFITLSGVNTFEYLDSAGATLTVPIADLHTVKGVRVNLASPVKSPTSTGNSAMSVQVSLRNRKTNL